MKNTLFAIAGTALFITVLGVYLKYSEEGTINLKDYVYTKSTVAVSDQVINVELANSNTKISKGLSGRNSLEEGNGMLFVFDKNDTKPSFWMKGMKFSIDIIWIKDEIIVKIDKNVPPADKNTPDNEIPRYNPEGYIDYVLEVNAGFSDKYNIKENDRIEINI